MTDAQNAVLSKIAYLDLPGKTPPMSIMDFVDYYRSNPDKCDESYEIAFSAIENDPEGLGGLTITAYDNQSENGFAAYGFESKNGESTVAFRGSESIGDVFKTKDAALDWLGEDIPGFVAPMTTQQFAALRFMTEPSPRGMGGARDVNVTGHSLGGRLAQTVALLYYKSGDCTSFNAPGFSSAFFNAFSLFILANRGRVRHLRTENDIASGPLADIMLADLKKEDVCPGDHALENFLRHYQEEGAYENTSDGGNGSAGGSGRGESLFGGSTLEVTPRQLIELADNFNASGNRVAKITSEILNLTVQLRPLWEGDSSRTYINRFTQLNDDIQRMRSMINEHVNDLREMAERYSSAENQNIELSNSLASDVIF